MERNLEAFHKLPHTKRKWERIWHILGFS